MQAIIENNTENIVLWEAENQLLFVFSELWKKTFTIHLENDSKNTIVFVANTCDITVTILCENTGGECDIYGIFWTNNQKNHVNIQTKIQADHCKVKKYLTSVMQEDSEIILDGNITIKKWCKKAEGHLLEENILLWQNIKIKALPMLDINSNDVVASHGVKIEKLDIKKLFYLQSKGISKKNAQILVVESYLNKWLDALSTLVEDEKNTVKDQFIKAIL